MRLLCWYCHKAVSTELTNNTIFRAIAVCPECLAKSDESTGLQLPDIGTEPQRKVK